MLTIVVEEWLMVNMLEKGGQREKIKQQNKFTPSTVIKNRKDQIGEGAGNAPWRGNSEGREPWALSPVLS